ncbi:hypothetical protein IQ250_00615 [Pseudanabaenaceae cyanobacterium LEGE 13415]|nr:hypothetical protein [Pseudanabaenaceae cyanobacterium LEGE 13415]
MSEFQAQSLSLQTLHSGIQRWIGVRSPLLGLNAPLGQARPLGFRYRPLANFSRFAEWGIEDASANLQQSEATGDSIVNSEHQTAIDFAVEDSSIEDNEESLRLGEILPPKSPILGDFEENSADEFEEPFQGQNFSIVRRTDSFDLGDSASSDSLELPSSPSHFSQDARRETGDFAILSPNRTESESKKDFRQHESVLPIVEALGHTPAIQTQSNSLISDSSSSDETAWNNSSDQRIVQSNQTKLIPTRIQHVEEAFPGEPVNRASARSKKKSTQAKTKRTSKTTAKKTAIAEPKQVAPSSLQHSELASPIQANTAQIDQVLLEAQQRSIIDRATSSFDELPTLINQSDISSVSTDEELQKKNLLEPSTHVQASTQIEPSTQVEPSTHIQASAQLIEAASSSHPPAPEWNSGLTEQSPLKGTGNNVEQSPQSVPKELSTEFYSGVGQQRSEELFYSSQAIPDDISTDASEPTTSVEDVSIDDRTSSHLSESLEHSDALWVQLAPIDDAAIPLSSNDLEPINQVQSVERITPKENLDQHSTPVDSIDFLHESESPTEWNSGLHKQSVPSHTNSLRFGQSAQTDFVYVDENSIQPSIQAESSFSQDYNQRDSEQLTLAPEPTLENERSLKSPSISAELSSNLLPIPDHQNDDPLLQKAQDSPNADVMSESEDDRLKPVEITEPSIEESHPAIEKQNSSSKSPKLGGFRGQKPLQTKQETSPNLDQDNIKTSDIELSNVDRIPLGFAIGGEVKASTHPIEHPVAPSDTVPAMLTPGEFVIKASEAQKHLDLLQHINAGGTIEHTNNPSSPSRSRIQRKISSTLLPKTAKTLSSENVTLPTSQSSYTQPSFIFRKAHSATAMTPLDEWSSIEDLLFQDESNTITEHRSTNSTHLNSIPKQFSTRQPQGFANGGIVPEPRSTNTHSTGETIQACPDPQESNALEALAREIYQRLQQRLELERERYGHHTGRLPW